MGDPNYITPAGAKRLQEELGDLRSRQRPRIVEEVAAAAAQGDRSENAEYIYGKRKLREIDRRMGFLTRRLVAAHVVDPAERPAGERDRVFFGATVDVEDEDGETRTYQIVGEDEIDVGRGAISYRSPLGRALLRKREGDTVVFQRPGSRPGSGDVELTVLAVRYPSLPSG